MPEHPDGKDPASKKLQSEDLVRQYAGSHTHPVNRLCHTLGIPIIVFSIVLGIVGLFDRAHHHALWAAALWFFAGGWVLQFIGHAFEGKLPEFFHDWRFLFVGVRWWMAKMRGKA